MNNEELLAKLIDDLDAGRCSLEECLASHPELGPELISLLEIANCIQSPNVAPSAEFKARARGRLMQEMANTPRQPLAAASRANWSWIRAFSPILKPSAAIALVITGISAAGGTTVYAAQGSLPQDTLYPIKRGVEDLRLAITINPADKAEINSTLADRRIDEAVTQARLGRAISEPALQSAASHIDAAVKQIGAAKPEQARKLLDKLSISTSRQQDALGEVMASAPEPSQPAITRAIETTRRASLIASSARGNPGILATSPSVREEGLEAAHFEVDGIFMGNQGASWNIGGVVIDNVDAIENAPEQSENVHIEGLIRGQKVFVSEIRHGEPGGNKMAGSGSADEDKAATTEPPTVRPTPAPSPTPVGGQATVNPKTDEPSEKNSDSEERGVDVKGALSSVDAQDMAMTLNVGGARVVIDLRGTYPRDGEGKIISLADLARMQGAIVRATGLVKKDGVISAQKILISIPVNMKKASQSDDDNGKRTSDSPGPDANLRATARPPTATLVPRGTADDETPTLKLTPVPERDKATATGKSR